MIAMHCSVFGSHAACHETLCPASLPPLLPPTPPSPLARSPHPPRRRGNSADESLRIVKTLLHTLCNIKGRAIRDHVARVARPDPACPDAVPVIHTYVEIALQSAEAAGGEGRGGGGGRGGRAEQHASTRALDLHLHSEVT